MLINLAHSPRVNPIIQFFGYFKGPILFGACGHSTYRLIHIPLTVMELAVLLAAGLRDWVDFGVIVRLRPRATFFLLSARP